MLLETPWQANFCAACSHAGPLRCCHFWQYPCYQRGASSPCIRATSTPTSNSGHHWRKCALQHHARLLQHQWKKGGDRRQKSENQSLPVPRGDRIRSRRRENQQTLLRGGCREEICPIALLAPRAAWDLLRLHCPGVPTAIPGSGRIHFLAAGSCHSQNLGDNQGIAVDVTCPNKTKPEALVVALPPLMHTVVPRSQ